MIEDAVYVRELLQDSVRSDLLGPAGGPYEKIVGMSVRDRYLVGKLKPMLSEDGGLDKVESLEVESGEDLDEEPSELKSMKEDTSQERISVKRQVRSMRKIFTMK